MDGILSNVTYGLNFGELIRRNIFVIVIAFFSAWIVSRNWEWYEKELDKRHITLWWHSANINAILWVIWWLTLGSIWGYHLRMHKTRYDVEALYLSLIFLTLSWQVALFEKKALSTAKWLALFSTILIGYIMYDSYYQGNALVAIVAVAHLIIMIYTVLQIWTLDVSMNSKKSLKTNDDTSYTSDFDSQSEHKHPWKIANNKDNDSTDEKWW